MNYPNYISLLVLLFSSCLSNSYAQPNTEQTLVRTNKHILDTETYDVKDLEVALKNYQQGIDSMHVLRTDFHSAQARLKLKKYSLPIFEEVVTALYLRYQQSGNVLYLEQAFEITEYSKSFTLLQGLQNTLAYYSNNKNRNAKNNQTFDKAYLKTKQSYDSLVFELEHDYPNHSKFKYKASLSTLKEIQTQLIQPKQLLLEYFVGNKHIYVFKISPHKKELIQLPMPSNYEELVYNLRSALTNYDLITEHPQWAYQALISASHKFYIAFFEPLISPSDEIEKITIIPDGILNYIPFEALIEKRPEAHEMKDRNYKKLDFILKRYPINYSYSASLLIKNHQQNKLNNNGQCLGFAPSTQFSNHQDSLPWTQKELKTIEAIFKGEYYYGTTANKTLFKKLSAKFSIIHLATHGIVNMENPMRSSLSFAALDSKNKEPAALYAYEIHDLSINANLVVLSACETGSGKLARGEGVWSLARAFLSAGAPSVVTTLWEVDDFTSAALIETFYSNLALGMSKPVALQQAKLTFLSKTDAFSGHPIYWASFISIGNPAPIKNGDSLWGILGIVAASIFVFFILIRIFRKA
jgi:CHAT domain-containing protein